MKTLPRRIPTLPSLVPLALGLLLAVGDARTAASQAAPPRSPAAAPAPSSATGRIAGRAIGKDREPVSYTQVGLVELRRGTQTDEQGRYVFDRVPPGDYTVELLSVAYGRIQKKVTVRAGSAAVADFTAVEERVVQIPEFEVKGTRKIDVKRSDTAHSFDRAKLEDMKASSFQEAVGRTAGVVATADGFHVRGGRASDVKLQISGISSSSALTSQSANVALLAVSNLEVLTGGMDAENGEALSAVIKLETREGGPQFGGDIRWDTDRFGDPTKTYDNYDRFTAGFGGPTPIRNLTYFATWEGAFDDTYLRSSFTRPTTTLLDFVRVGNRQSNRVNSSLKFAWRPGAADKVTLEGIQNRTFSTPYEHMWSRTGFVKVDWDTIHGTDGTPDSYQPRYGSWSSTALDSTYQPVNLADHVPSTDDRFRQVTAVWTHQMGSGTVWTSRFSNFAYRLRSSVGGKAPWEYDTQNPFYWAGNTVAGSENNPYFATHGDLPAWSDQTSETWVAKTDLATRRWKSHAVKGGVEARYNRLANLTLIGPNGEVNGLPGGSRSSYVNFNPEGSAFLQDRWEFEGLVINGGVHYDLFTPGDQVSANDLPSGRRFKQQLSPRLGIAYPISDKDVLSFHYGWTYQTPSRNYVFENRGALASVAIRGNPDLEPQTNISYQAGVQHLFSRDVAGQFAVFFNDLYGLISTRAYRDEAGNVLPQFVNEDYASSRGFEMSVSKSFSHHFSADVNYTYSFATGVSSDPNSALQFINGGRLYLPISEQALRWDQRHTLSVQGLVRDPGRWGFHFAWDYGSGLPFTPAFRNDRRSDPVFTNSRRFPSRATLNLDGDKYYKVWGRPVTLFFDARNVLDARNVVALSPNAVANPNVNLAGDDYTTYYTETGRAGGAYLQDTNGDGVLDWVPVKDPRVFEEGRHVRLGISTSF